jgi:hypothetical protein
MREATLLMSYHAEHNPADYSHHLVDRRVAEMAV